MGWHYFMILWETFQICQLFCFAKMKNSDYLDLSFQVGT